MSRSAFVTHPTLERMPGRPSRWPVVLGTAAGVLLISAVLSRPSLPPPPGDPPQAVLRIPAWYAQPRPAQAVQAAPAPIQVASAEPRRSPAKPRPASVREASPPAAAAPAEQVTAAGLEGLY